MLTLARSLISWEGKLEHSMLNEDIFVNLDFYAGDNYLRKLNNVLGISSQIYNFYRFFSKFKKKEI